MTLLPNIPRKEEEIEKYCEALLAVMRSDENKKQEFEPLLIQLEALLDRYRHEKELQIKAHSVYQEVTAAKLKQIEDMTGLMRICRKHVNKFSVGEKTKIIEKVSATDRNSIPPSDPRMLRFEILDRGKVLLEWRRPKKGMGGIIFVTEIQVRYPEEDKWNIFETTDGTTKSITISTSGKNQVMEFRIMVKNQAGYCTNGSNIVRVFV